MHHLWLDFQGMKNNIHMEKEELQIFTGHRCLIFS